jgi:hypothetical protein
VDDLMSLSKIRAYMSRMITHFGIWKVSLAITVVLLLAFVLFLETGVTGCQFKEVDSSSSPARDEESSSLPRRSEGQGQEPSWAYTYASMADICTYSDVIAIGTVEELIKTKEAGAMLYKSFWDFKVDEMLKGDKVKKLTILQTGSPNVPGSDFQSDPLFLSGDRYLIFLRKSSESNLFYHPQGRFFIWNERIYSMDYILPEDKAMPSVPGFNCNGVDLNTIKDKITEIVNSVQLLFTHYKTRVPSDVIRYSAGVTVQVYVSLSTGNNGPGKITYTVDSVTLPEGITTSFRPVEFVAEPYSEYESTLIITTDYKLPPGGYRISVGYDFEGIGSGNRILTFNVN